jgi:hypothetical protein
LTDHPVAELVAILAEARAMLSRPGNDFTWSGWDDAAHALYELDTLIAALSARERPRPVDLELLFSPTGPIQEVSLSSGWADQFLALAQRFDLELGKVYGA